MKTQMAVGLAMIALAQGGISQVVAPASPKKFVPRAIGGGSTGGVEVIPRDGKTTGTVRYTTRITLSPARIWTSTDGKQLDARLIAFEDLIVEGPEGGAPPPAPPAPESPTVVRDGKVRLWLKDKPVEVPLTRLSQADLDFIEQVRKVHEKKKPEPEP
jgi:hypothetical protein